MERRYLVAALAIIAAFAVTSRGFRALERIAVANDHDQHFWTLAKVGAMAKARCEANSAAQAVAKVRTHLRPRFPEEAQLLAEMNVPLVNLQSTIDEQMVRQDEAISRCARERAMREAEHARRDAQRWQEKMSHTVRDFSQPPAASWALQPDLAQHLQEQTAALAGRLAANQVKLQIAAAKMAEASVPDVDVVVDTNPVVVTPDVRCNVKTSQHGQTKHKVMYYSFTTK